MRCSIFLISFISMVAVVCTCPAQAQTQSGRTTGPPVVRSATFSSGVGPLLLAAIPGAAVHGLGHWTAGDPRTARRLFGLQGLGITMVAIGAYPLLATHASGDVIDFSVGAIVAGLGLFAVTWLSDIYGAGLGNRRSPAPLIPALFTQQLGMGFIYDPLFPYRLFTVVGAQLFVRRVNVAPLAWLAGNGDNQRLSADISVRILGHRPTVRTPDNSTIDFRLGGVYHRYAKEQFAVADTTFSFPMRLDLQRLAPTLTGTFATFEWGWGLQYNRYQTHDVAGTTDKNGLLMLRVGYGVYLGRRRPAGEIEIYYNHRHDGYTGGFAAPLHEPNFLGHVGMRSVFRINNCWAIDSEVQYGSALVSRFGLSYRFAASGGSNN